MKKANVTDKAPGTPSLISQAIEANGFVFTGGFIHSTPDGTVIEGSVDEKVKQIMSNLQAVLEAAAGEPSKTAKNIWSV
jgi:2-iminobutanoate/2-iminopropanoate deaminase